MAKSVNALPIANPKRRSCRMRNRLNNTTGRTTRRLSPTNWGKSFGRLSVTKFIALYRLDTFLYLLGIGRQISQNFDDNIVGEEAKDLFANAQAMIDKLIKENWSQLKRCLNANAQARHGAGTGRPRQCHAYLWAPLRQHLIKPVVNLITA